MDVLHFKDLVHRLKDPMVAEAHAFVSNADPLLVDLSTVSHDPEPVIQPACPVIGVVTSTTLDQPIPEVVDVVAHSPAEMEILIRACRNSPQAATVLVQVLRHNAGSDVWQGLLTESLAYSTLQHGSTFVNWLGAKKPAAGKAPQDESPVLMARVQDELTVTLNRPALHNAYSAAMRDGLIEALQLALLDQKLRVRLMGNGPSFSAGGDLNEFGEARDAAIAHVTRTARSAAWMMHQLKDRMTVQLHGACIGAGIELPAFCARIEARRDALFRLPEVGFGLVPGAGGTVSVTRRIGRLKTAWFALSDQTIDAVTALEWGLIDSIN
ncbi:MAG: enoyl-CoA hydratase/isomerase family protein [Proteobacteria bacterium]|nr:enoyl-CoA hydratase/isomerase family protein [Pseudomonadota bacterium]